MIGAVRSTEAIVAGRRRDARQQVVAGRSNMHTMAIDADSAVGVADFARRVTAEHPALNVVINNAGIMRFEPLNLPRDLSDAEAIVITNLLGPIQLTDTLIEHLGRQPDAALVNPKALVRACRAFPFSHRHHVISGKPFGNAF